MRILVLSQHYRPEPNFITADVAEALAAGCEVTVVTAHPNYPLGRFYAGTAWWRPMRTLENGVTVWRVPFLPDRSASAVRRSVSYASFAIAAALVAAFVARRPDVVWVYQGPFTAILASIWFKIVFRSRVVLTCADLWPESFVAAGVTTPGPLLRASYWYRRMTNRLADHIIGSTRGTVARFASEGFPRNALSFVPVWVEGIDSAASDSPVAPAEPVIVYAGNLGPAQQLETVVEAAAMLQRGGAKVRFDLYGSGSAEDGLRGLVNARGLRNVRFAGRVPPHEAFAASTAAFAQIVCLRSDPHFAMTIPSKLILCFAAGPPILCGLEGEGRQLVDESGGGLCYRPDDAAGLAAAIEELLSESVDTWKSRVERNRCFYRSRFDRDRLLEEYRAILAPLPGT